MVFKQATADLNQIIQHLWLCNTLFEPNLETYVDINDYAEKIFKNATTFEIWEKGILVGLVACYLNDEKKEAGYITNVSILKEFQGRKIANTLLNNTINYSKEIGFNQLFLEVMQHNYKALNLYKKFGFIVKSTNEVRVGNLLYKNVLLCIDLE